MSVATNPNLVTFRAAQKDAITVYKNGEYVVDLAKSITMYPGSALNVWSSFIDTQQLTTDTVIIPNDISVGLSFMYYETYTDKTNKTALNGANEPDNDFYYMTVTDASNSRETYIRNIDLNVAAGSWTPDRIAQYLSEEFSKSQTMTDSVTLTTGNTLLIGTDTAVGGGAVTALNNIDWGDKPYPYASIQELDGDENAWGPEIDGKPYYLGNGFGPASQRLGGAWVSLKPSKSTPTGPNKLSDSDYHITSTGTNGAGSGLVIKVQDYNKDTPIGWFGPNYVRSQQTNRIYYSIVDGGQNYTRGDLVYFDSEQFCNISESESDSYEYHRCSTGARLILTVEGIKDGNSFFEFLKVGEDPANPSNSYRYTGQAYFVGASEVDIEYNNNNNGAFAINYLHTPFYTTVQDQPLKPAVKLYVNPESRQWTTITVDSGIFITSMNPKSFWEDIMNFRTNDIVIDDISGNRINNTDRLPLGSIQGKYPYGYLGLNGFLNTGNGASSREFLNESVTIDTTLTVPIQAEEFRTDSGAGYYIIEIEGFHKQEIVGSTKAFQASAIVSKQYSQNDLVTGFAESGIPYLHTGEPITFSSLKIRIIDPDTDDVADLGEDNTIFLRLQPPAPEPAPVQKK